MIIAIKPANDPNTIAIKIIHMTIRPARDSAGELRTGKSALLSIFLFTLLFFLGLAN